MKNVVSGFHSLADAVNLWRENPACSYRAQANAVSEALCEAAAHDEGILAIELADDSALPEPLRGRHIPAISAVRVVPVPKHVFHERAVTVYVDADDIDAESERRGRPVECCLMETKVFLDYVGSHELSARFVSGKARFSLLWHELNYARARASLRAEEEEAQRKRELAALRAAWDEEVERIVALEEAGEGSRFFTPLLGVIAAVNAELPDDRRALYAVSCLVRESFISAGEILVARRSDDELPENKKGRFLPKTERVMVDGEEQDALVVYTTDEIPYHALMEHDRLIEYRAFDACAFLEYAHEKGLPAKIVTTKRALIVPFSQLEEGYCAM